MEKQNKMGEVEEREEPNPSGERENGTQSPRNQELQEEPHLFREKGRRGSATRRRGRRWDKPILDGLYILSWPGHLVMDPGTCV